MNNPNGEESSSSSQEEPPNNPPNPKIRVLSVKLDSNGGDGKSMEPFPGLVEWVEWAYLKLQQGVDFNERMRTNKEFRNPGILEKMVAYCELDELGTNFDRNVFNPKGYDSSEYYEALAEKQRVVATKEALRNEPKRGVKNEEQGGNVSSSWKGKRGRSTRSRWD